MRERERDPKKGNLEFSLTSWRAAWVLDSRMRVNVKYRGEIYHAYSKTQKETKISKEFTSFVATETSNEL